VQNTPTTWGPHTTFNSLFFDCSEDIKALFSKALHIFVNTLAGADLVYWFEIGGNIYVVLIDAKINR
jgi:hypothetical protein